MVDAPSNSDLTTSSYLDESETMSVSSRPFYDVISLTPDSVAAETLKAASAFAIRANSSERIWLVSHASILSAALDVGLRYQGAQLSLARFANWLMESKISEDRIQTWLKVLRRPPEAPLALTTSAERVIERAQSYASRTVGHTNFNARHLMAALLTPPDDAFVQRIADAWKREFSIELGAFRGVLLDYVDMTYRGTSENMPTWRSILDPEITATDKSANTATDNDTLNVKTTGVTEASGQIEVDGSTTPRERSNSEQRPDPKPTESRPIEAVEPQSDEPTTKDQLGRRLFAQALVERMDRLYEKEGHDGFAIHLHAPWGAGKTSVLRMMREFMTTPARRTMGSQKAPEWIVVFFNAWQHERRNPPWLPLIEKIKAECLHGLVKPDYRWPRAFGTWIKSLSHRGPTRSEHRQAVFLQARWLWWRFRTAGLPYVAAVAVSLIFLWFLWSASYKAAPTALDWILKSVAAVIAIFTAVFSASRIVLFGSATVAKFYEDISHDPLKRIVGLFQSLVDKTGRPLCVFIDDLDRCRIDYVVDLLEGIQTSFRHTGVAYVVAADRSWIRTSFEAKYGEFSSSIGSLGQPLGYLFLEKIFQLSTPVPGMGDKTRATFWSGLLKGTAPLQEGSAQAESSIGEGAPLSSAASKQQFDDVVEKKRAELRSSHGPALTGEQAKAILQTRGTEADRAAVILELNASPAAHKEAKHLLEQFAEIVPDNPRVMKRMVNAFAMRQAIGILERSVTPSEVLARWTILEQRFPVLADLLIEHPEWVDTLKSQADNFPRSRAENVLRSETDDKEGPKLPPPLLPFAESEIVHKVIGEKGPNALTVEHVRVITRGQSA